ncbi:T9SS type A sorting domain-containing protein [Schleiferiaceae bacterium]|nr:T9SS type A sorting domain-containing protein [Schleiferiaceae bacterium]MDC1028478.1 T9SS type A sorting domain-containing protein [Schleiferiaceae bacterium]
MKKWIGCIMLVITTPLLAQVNCVTTPDQLGPYFIENAPIITNDTLAPGVNDTASALQLTFYVSSNCDTVDLDSLASTYMVELWHTNALGDYSNVDGNPNDFAYRGKLELSGKSTVVHTELPGIYPYRPSHIHLKSYLTDAWFTDTLVTQVYFEGDSLIPYDIANSFPERWIRLDTTAKGFTGGFAFGLALHIGMEERDDAPWTCFPNPAINIITLKTDGSDGAFQIIDMRGSVQFEGDIADEGTIDISDWPRGSYIVRNNGTAQLLLVQ